MKTEFIPREGSYEASLTGDERIELHSLLLSGGPLHELREKTLPWRAGPDQGAKPSIATLWKIQSRLRAEQMMFGLETMLDTVKAGKRQLDALARASNQEQILDAAMTLIGQEVIVKAMEGHGLAMQQTISKLLLKRADQRRFDRRMRLEELNSDLETGE